MYISTHLATHATLPLLMVMTLIRFAVGRRRHPCRVSRKIPFRPEICWRLENDDVFFNQTFLISANTVRARILHHLHLLRLFSTSSAVRVDSQSFLLTNSKHSPIPDAERATLALEIRSDSDEEVKGPRERRWVVKQRSPRDDVG